MIPCLVLSAKSAIVRSQSGNFFFSLEQFHCPAITHSTWMRILTPGFMLILQMKQLRLKELK